MGSSEMRALHEQFGQTVLPKLFIAGINNFRYTIGVKQQRITFCENDRFSSGKENLSQTNCRRGWHQPSNVIALTSIHGRWIMPRVYISQCKRDRIKASQKHCHKGGEVDIMNIK